MQRYPSGRQEDARWRGETGLWVVACVGFVVGDIATTSLGLETSGVVELHPLASPPLPHSVLGAMLAVKLGFAGGCYLLWTYVPRPHRLGIPLGLALVGVLVTAWNLSVLARAGLC